MKVSIYHNISRDASFGLNAVFADGGKRQAVSAEEQHQLVKVFEYDEPKFTTLEAAFRRFNIEDDVIAGSYRSRRLRSLSVGDVVVVNSDKTLPLAFSVDSFGFGVRHDSELRVVTDPDEAETLIRSRYGFEPQEELAVTVPWKA
jgi:hypothetical protein